MKRIFAFFVPCVCLVACCACSDYKLKKEIGEKLSLDLSNAEIVKEWSDRGWFNDGNSLVAFTLPEETIVRLEALIVTTEKEEEYEVWREMPLRGIVYNIFYGENDYGDDWFRNHKTGEKAIPHIENGYWWYTGGTTNFDFAAFDADTEILYYYEFDS